MMSCSGSGGSGQGAWSLLTPRSPCCCWSGSEPPNVGGPPKWGGVQWAPGELQQLDGHQLAVRRCARPGTGTNYGGCLSAVSTAAPSTP